MNVSMAAVAADLGTTISGHPDRDHPLHARDGHPDDHRRQAGHHPGPAAGVPDRSARLRRRLAHHRPGAEPRGAADRLVPAGGHRRVADHAGDRRPGRGQLPARTAGRRLRPGRRRRCDGRGGRTPDRWCRDDVRVLALRVRRRGGPRARHPRVPAQDRRRPAGPRPPRPRRVGAVGRGPRQHRLRRAAVQRVGLGAGQAGGADDPRGVPGRSGCWWAGSSSSDCSCMWEQRVARHGDGAVAATRSCSRNSQLAGGLTHVLLPVPRAGRACSSPCRCSCPSCCSWTRSRPVFGSCRCRWPCCWPPAGYPRSTREANPRRVVRVGLVPVLAGVAVPRGRHGSRCQRRRRRDPHAADRVRIGRPGVPARQP